MCHVTYRCFVLSTDLRYQSIAMCGWTIICLHDCQPITLCNRLMANLCRGPAALLIDSADLHDSDHSAHSSAGSIC